MKEPVFVTCCALPHMIPWLEPFQALECDRLFSVAINKLWETLCLRHREARVLVIVVAPAIRGTTWAP